MENQPEIDQNSILSNEKDQNESQESDNNEENNIDHVEEQ